LKDVFNTLWSVLPHPPGSVVRLFARRDDHRAGDYARNAAEIRKFVRQHPDMNIYVALNPTCSTKGLRHRADEVSHWSFFPIDVDPIEEKNYPLTALTEALDWLGEWTGKDLSTATIIDSGRGAQAWLRLDDYRLSELQPEPIHTSYARSTARRVTGYWMKKLDEKLGLCHGCRIDTSVTDLPRVMRCPGTINRKTGRMADFMTIRKEPIGGLGKLMVVGTPPEAVTDPPKPEGVAPGQRWQKVFTHMTVMAQNYLMLGQEEPGRHKVMWHTAKKLHELGVSVEEARRALQRANGLKGEAMALPLDQVEHALETAYQVSLTTGEES